MSMSHQRSPHPPHSSYIPHAHPLLIHSNLLEALLRVDEDRRRRRSHHKYTRTTTLRSHNNNINIMILRPFINQALSSSTKIPSPLHTTFANLPPRYIFVEEPLSVLRHLHWVLLLMLVWQRHVLKVLHMVQLLH